jgi:hypothetical protein
MCPLYVNQQNSNTTMVSLKYFNKVIQMGKYFSTHHAVWACFLINAQRIFRFKTSARLFMEKK